jgi:hypothetical protein
MVEAMARAQREAVQYREAMATEAEGRNGKATGQHISEALAQDVVPDPDSRQQPTPDPRVQGPRPSRRALTATQLARCVLQRKAAEQRKALRLMEKTKPEVVLGAAEVGDLADATPSVAVQACVLVSTALRTKIPRRDSPRGIPPRDPPNDPSQPRDPPQGSSPQGTPHGSTQGDPPGLPPGITPWIPPRRILPQGSYRGIPPGPLRMPLVDSVCAEGASAGSAPKDHSGR